MAWQSGRVGQVEEIIVRDLIIAEHKRATGVTIVPETRLIWMARYRATDMALRNYWGHATPEGKGSNDYLKACGVQSAYHAEIIAANSSNDTTTAQDAFNQWMNSTSGHREIIQKNAYTQLGVGAFKFVNRKYYVVLFRKPPTT